MSELHCIRHHLVGYALYVKYPSQRLELGASGFLSISKTITNHAVDATQGATEN